MHVLILLLVLQFLSLCISTYGLVKRLGYLVYTGICLLNIFLLAGDIYQGLVPVVLTGLHVAMILLSGFISYRSWNQMKKGAVQ